MPRKPAVSPAPPSTTHKPRAAWFQARTCYPWRDAHVDYVVEGRQYANQLKLAENLNWQSAGPTNIGGRATSLAVDPRDPDVVYLGTAGGGVWRTGDAGRTWIALWHNEDVLHIGSLAIDTHPPHFIYGGTGEANGSADSYPGVGLYRSADDGKTWTLLAPAKNTGIPGRIGTIAIDPFDSQHIRLGGLNHMAGSPAGMFTSRDGGVNWRRESFIAPENYFCHSIAFHPKRGVIFATFDARGALNGIWRSIDDGETWSHLTEGLPSPEFFHRTSLAISPSHPDVIYAVASDNNFELLGVFQSTDMGDTWHSIGGTPSQPASLLPERSRATPVKRKPRPAQSVHSFAEAGLMVYNNCIAVHPANPDCVLWGGRDLYRTTDGGVTWTRATAWDADPRRPGYAHADHHALAILLGKDGRMRVYDANDGGMAVSENGADWTTRSNGLAITMFYDVDMAAGNGKYFGGGCQDEGTVLTRKGTADSFETVLSGDGAWVAFDPETPDLVFGSANKDLARHDPGARWAERNWTPITLNRATPEELSSIFLAIIVIHPADPKTVFTASNRVWRSNNRGRSWTAVSPVFDGTPISAIEVAPADPRYVYAGTEKGCFYRSLHDGDPGSWSGNLAGPHLPGRIITRVESRPRRAEVVLVTVGTVAEPGNRNFSHVFRSTDGGLSWTDVDRGRLPNVPHQAIAFRGDAPDCVFIASDCGVYYSPDLGDTWWNATGSLPSVQISDLVYHDHDRTLIAATDGRGLWRLQLTEPFTSQENRGPISEK